MHGSAGGFQACPDAPVKLLSMTERVRRPGGPAGAQRAGDRRARPGAARQPGARERRRRRLRRPREGARGPAGGDGALNLPSAGDVERLERRLRSFSQRLEEVEDQLDRVSREVIGRRSSPPPRPPRSAPEDRRLTLNFRLRVRPRRPVRPASRLLSQRLLRRAAAPSALSATIRTAAAATPSAPARARSGDRLHVGGDRRPGGRRPAGSASTLATAAAPAPSPSASRRRLGQRPGRARPPRRRRRRSEAALTRRRRSPRSTRSSSPAAAAAPAATAGADPHRPPHAELGEVGEHERRARPAHPGRLDRQLVARRASGPSSPRGRGRGCSSSAARAAPGRAAGRARGRRRGSRRPRSGLSAGVATAWSPDPIARRRRRLSTRENRAPGIFSSRLNTALEPRPYLGVNRQTATAGACSGGLGGKSNEKEALDRRPGGRDRLAGPAGGGRRPLKRRRSWKPPRRASTRCG